MAKAVTLQTIKPGAYPAAGNWMRRLIFTRGDGQDHRTITQMYFPGEPLNDKRSPACQNIRANKDGLIAKVLGRQTSDVEPDSRIVVWDIVLTRVTFPHRAGAPADQHFVSRL